MTTIAEMVRRVKSLDIMSESVAIIEKNKEILIADNRDQLNNFGIDKNGFTLPPYSPKYRERKLLLNPKGVVDAKLTGALQGAMYLKVNVNGFTIGSSDEKEGKNEQRNGKDMWGVTKQNLSVFAKGVFYDNLKEYVTKKTGLKFR
jgi:hypothetical protein